MTFPCFLKNKLHVPNHQAVSLSFNGQTTNQSQFDGSSCFHIKKRPHPRIGAVQVAYAVVDFNEDLSTSLDPRFYPANYIHAFTVNQQELPIIQGIVWNCMNLKACSPNSTQFHYTV